MGRYMAPDYPRLFCEIIAKHAQSVRPSKPRGGVDCGLREISLSRHISDGLRNGAIALPPACPPIIVDQTIFGEMRRRIDYAFVLDEKTGVQDVGNILATVEVKGPVRGTFFDPERSEGNWVPYVAKDIGRQHERCGTAPRAEHYLALLMPYTESWIRTSTLFTILDLAKATVPSARLQECATQTIPLSNNCPLTAFVYKVTHHEEVERLEDAKS
jgi:hypothetical protein